MKIKIYAIAKKQNNHNEFMAYIKQFGVKLEVIDIFNANIQKAHKTSPNEARISYTKEFERFINKNAMNIALHPNGKIVDSYELSDMMKNSQEVNFFIGGAFGFEERFLKQTKPISLSKLTFSHKIVKIILCEQIFRTLCIINNHPYHRK
ncbi:hypothetical protein CCY99_05735 [Helicobacter sp. 16-1353]|uniref:23S rRNA (pseudouridine(1915)-N(3))-methyltransferase RlmH n=1 Tax=Helicobacter sp. 16-1353 TaxID=2004996 RepID=UPI000DCCD9C1|nr:23S rRNA (pseudouridine(1915)-N(3))-methyltransferase RlmH [Helicobacter sp. 16-1353]RAX53881.1 hypothetical protein CCY99_05735 [Helicobacter sp. 16-1353]